MKLNLLIKPQLIAVLLLLSFTVSAQLKVAQIFSNHSVLQRDQPVKIWGNALPNSNVNVSFLNQNVNATADNSGKWLVTLNAMSANKTPQMLSVKSGPQIIILNDILVGDVWLCSGQSNMEWRLKDANNAQTEVAGANYPLIRHFKVPLELEFTPQQDLNGGEWEVATPKTAAEFTAVGYFFARHLQKELDVPIGLLNSSWGGSQVESWISNAAIKSSEVLGYYAETMPRNWAEDAQQTEQKLMSRIYGSSNIDIEKINENEYLNPTYDYDKWLNANVPGQWQWSGFPSFLGTVYLQKFVEIPESFTNQITEFSFGNNSGEFELIVNGKTAFKGFAVGAINTKISAGTWKSGANNILIKVSENIDNGWKWMGFGGNKNDFYVKTEVDKITLNDKAWKMIPSWQSERTYTRWMNNAGSIIYNSMIAPITDYGIKGAIWYQGESNAGRAFQYRKSFPLMIENWRQYWGYDFPFFTVQLSSYGGFQSSNEGSNWAELREAQTMTLQLPKTGMAVTTDIGNPDDIHPRNKQDVGHRLALSALKVAYEKDLVYSGPTYKSVAFTKGEAALSFENAGSGLMAKDKYGYLTGFEIAGSDQKFYYAKAEIKGDKIIVSHSEVKDPKSVRYGWTNSPIDANLFNKEGLPASPFRTDNWKGITENEKFE
ncbi:MAG: sialate O-acetylesterase [Spirosomaceae bacterium]|nr:sialate O-acetylesterase [Spirosomataceae bacterium]